MNKPHEALHCMPCEKIYDDLIAAMGCELVIIGKLEKLLSRRAQLPEQYFSNRDDAKSLSEIVSKYYGKQVCDAITAHLLDGITPKIGEPP